MNMRSKIAIWAVTTIAALALPVARASANIPEQPRPTTTITEQEPDQPSSC